MSSENEINKLRQNLNKGTDLYMNKPNKNQKHSNDELWIDKYRPKSYNELLTDERINREILTWMKSWDEIVFKRKFTTPEVSINILGKVNEFGSIQNNSTQNKNYKKEVEYVQSKHKIILIAGPPGIGKTTLAKIIAKHCGYDPLVINASDERTSDQLIMRIYDTTLIHNLNITKKNSRPTCLILDEIDGIVGDSNGKSSIKDIIDFIKEGKVNKNILNKAKLSVMNNTFLNSTNKFVDRKDKETTSQDEDAVSDEENLQPNKPKKTNSIKRPIICICNDLYSKVLSYLRKEALVYHIKKADDKKMVERVNYICKREGLDVDISLIKTLCEKTRYDIRASLNSLQFISYDKSNLQHLLSSSSFGKLSMLGHKDIHEGLFVVWSRVFAQNKESSLNVFKSIENLFSSYGEYDLINEGIFTNYLKLPNKESPFEIANRVKIAELFSYNDIITRKINAQHLYELSRFQTLPASYIKCRYQTNQTDKFLDFPTFFIEAKKNKKLNSRIMECVRESSQSGQSMSRQSMVVDIIPYVSQLIQPEIREINPSLMNKNEVQQLKRSITIMQNFGIKFQEKSNAVYNDENEDDQEIVYEPDISRLVKYDNVESKRRLSTKQMLIMMMEYEKTKRMNNLIDEKDGVNEIKEKLNGMGMTFGKKRTYTEFATTEYKFVYKFNEGVTNCVRRTLNIKYFLK